MDLRTYTKNDNAENTTHVYIYLSMSVYTIEVDVREELLPHCRCLFLKILRNNLLELLGKQSSNGEHVRGVFRLAAGDGQTHREAAIALRVGLHACAAPEKEAGDVTRHIFELLRTSRERTSSI